MSFWKGRKILVTGGAGFICSHLARKLLSEGAEVTVVDNFSTGKMSRIEDLINERNFRYFNADLREMKSCRMATNGQDYVFHMAANMGGIGYITKVGADIMYDNLQMNTNMLKASLEEGVKRFFYSSSACVYPEELQANPNVVPLKEDDAIPANPDTFYGWEKLVTEKLCESFSEDYGLETRIARFHNIYGPYADFEEPRAKAIGALIRKAIRYPGEDFIVWGTGKQTRSFLYIDDAVRAILLLMASDFTKPLNIGTDHLVTIDELAKKIIALSGKDIRIKHDSTKPVGVNGRNADLTLVKQVLGWAPKVSLDEGLERTYQWVENDFQIRQLNARAVMRLRQKTARQ